MTTDTPWTDARAELGCVNADEVRELERSHARLLEALEHADQAGLFDANIRRSARLLCRNAINRAIK